MIPVRWLLFRNSSSDQDSNVWKCVKLHSAKYTTFGKKIYIVIFFKYWIANMYVENYHYITSKYINVSICFSESSELWLNTFKLLLASLLFAPKIWTWGEIEIYYFLWQLFEVIKRVNLKSYFDKQYTEDKLGWAVPGSG